MIELQTQKPLKIISYSEVVKLLGISRTTLWRCIKNGDFPGPRKYFTGKLGWPSTEIDDYILNTKQIKTLPKKNPSWEDA